MKTKFKSQRKGAVLATVTVVSVMMVVIIMAATQLVAHTNVKTNEVYRKKQAYYVAASCVRAFVSETTGFSHKANNTDAEIMAQIKQLKDLIGQETEVKIQRLESGTAQEIKDSQPRWNNATCTIRVEEVGSSDCLKVIATGSYLGETKKVVAYLTCQTDKMHVFKPKALEIIGTDGGITVKPQFENLQVYGSTAASSRVSHDNNVVYKFDHNKNQLYGDVDINGSMTVQNANVFYSNPYYYPTVDDSKGCVINVSRSLVFVANVPKVAPSHKKNLTDQTLNPSGDNGNFNYINVLEALVLTSENALIGVDDEKAVDTYASTVCFASKNNLDNVLRKTMAENHTVSEGDYVTDYWNEIQSYCEMQSGNDNIFHGNIYVYDNGGFWNGDMMVYRPTHVTGDIFIEGDLYIDFTDSSFTANAIHLAPGSNIYQCKRTYNPDGSVATPSAAAYEPNTITCGGKEIKIIREENWKTLYPRAKRPECPLLSESQKPYYYYPEHLLCLHNSAVSTIYSQYEKMYVDDGSGHQWKLDTDNVKRYDDVTFKNTDGTVYTDDFGGTGRFKPDYIVTDDCYIDNLKGAGTKILIDVDELPTGKKNLVVVLKDGGHCDNNNVILVKNSTDPDKDGAKFVYFVSDSGVGTVNDEYGNDGKSVSTYDHSTFKTSTFNFDGAHNVVMDLQTFFHSDVYDGGEDARGNFNAADGTVNENAVLNPTEDKEHTGYMLPSNNIIFLFTEGCELACKQGVDIFQASIYMPRATYSIDNHGRNLQISPDFVGHQMNSVSILGNLVCEHYNVKQGNNNAIVYNDVSPKSMLACVKGFGEEKASESFVLDHYAAS